MRFDYPRWQYARIDGKIEKRIIHHTHHEEPEIWKESPADLVPDVAADSEEAAQLAENAELVPAVGETNAEAVEPNAEPTPAIKPSKSKGKGKKTPPGGTEAAPEAAPKV